MPNDWRARAIPRWKELAIGCQPISDGRKNCPSCGCESKAGAMCKTCNRIVKITGRPVYLTRLIEALCDGVDAGRREALTASALEGKELRAFLRVTKARYSSGAICARIYYRKNRVSVRLRAET